MTSLNLKEEQQPRFFKILLQTAISEKRLRIFPSVSKKYFDVSTSSNPATATLTTPTGSSWEVHVLKTSGNDGPEVWIQGVGWENFVTFHSLKHGHFLVFQYEGDARYSVFVFAITGAEITYPPTGPKSAHKKPHFHQPKTEEAELLDEDVVDVDVDVDVDDDVDVGADADADADDISVEIIPDLDYRHPKSGKTAGDGATEHKKKENRGGFQHVKSEEVDAESGDDTSVEIVDESFSPLARRAPTSSSSKSSNQSSRVKRQRWNQNPSFRLVIRNTYVKFAHANIERDFARKHLMLKEQTLKLQLADNKKKKKKNPQQKQEWPVRAHKVNGRDEMYLADGWLRFVRDNSLKVGDDCVFEIIGVDTWRVLQVTIFRRIKGY